jgi:hypothetical protein
MLSGIHLMTMTTGNFLCLRSSYDSKHILFYFLKIISGMSLKKRASLYWAASKWGGYIEVLMKNG